MECKGGGVVLNGWMYLVLLPLLTTCLAYQTPPPTTVQPPPHRGAARQMYGSGSLRPAGSNPPIYAVGQHPAPSTPPAKNNPRRFPMSYPMVPVSIPMRDFDIRQDGYPIFVPDYYPDRESSPRSSGRASNRGGMYGGRPEYYAGRPDRRFPIDPAFIPGRGFDTRPGHGFVKYMPTGIVQHGVLQSMREPVEEETDDDPGAVPEEDQCGRPCERGEYLCAFSCTCIKNSYRCDGDIDCEHNEDELGCGETELELMRSARCEETDRYVRCPVSRKCISKEWMCDGDDDCGDYSDETHCGPILNCTTEQFECANGLCIPKNWLCDNDNDCKDFSDEMNCTKLGCTQDEFPCADGSCISLSWKCDRDQDCSDGSDEMNCDIEPPSCNNDEFQCPYQKCIKIAFKCDGDNDCGDWSDEDDCQKNPGDCDSGEFKCNSGKCIPENWKCDKQQDCEGNEDEINCTESNTRTCSEDEHTCNSGVCILNTWVCDGVSDCTHDEDEENCQIICDESKFACSGDNPNNTNTEFCIQKKHVCDGQRDCPKGEDEQLCPTKHACTNSSKCSQICITKANGTEACACNLGYNLAKDGFSCVDINECMYETDPVCSQTCNNTIGSFKCGCMTGYILRPDMRSCKAMGAPPTLLFANRMDIRQVSLSNNKYTAILKGLHNAIALDYHYTKNLIFWSDVSMDVIRKAFVNGTGSRDVIKWGLESPGGVALDWVHDLIFWTDAGTRRVEVASLNGKQRAVIVASDLDKPRAIVVHPGNAYIFWTDWGPKPKIERIEMDGSNRMSVITESVFWPNGLTLDYTNDRIYWADAKHSVIETALYDGSERKKVISKGLPHPFALTIFEDAIYWTDWHTKSISTANKATGVGLSTIHSNLHFPMDIHSYHSQRQPNYTSHCGADNGGCAHLCLPNKKGFSCVCRMGMQLTSDRKTCQNPDKLLIFARKKDLRIKHLDKNAVQHEIVVPIDGIKSAVAITWDDKTDTVFWTDLEKATINKAHWNGSNHKVVVKNNIASPAGLAFDWFTDKLYWTDAGTARIEVCNLDGSIRGLLIWDDLDKPRDIVVDPTAGYMYWSAWGEKPKIERAAMDGTERSVVVTHNLTWPNGLAIDHETGRLYWSDAGSNSIEYSNLDGTNRRVLLSGTTLPHPFGLDVFGNNIYWTDWQTWNIEKANKFTGLNRTVVSSGISDLMDVRVFHRNRRSRNTPCHKNNGGCSHLCLLKPSGHSCACPIGIKLQPDGLTCNKGPLNSLIFAHRVDIRQISLDVPYVVDVVMPFPPQKHTVSVDVDRLTGEIYWTDTASDLIQKSTPDGKDLKTVLMHELQTADAIAIDSTGRKMYWTDGGRNSIEVAELDGTNRKVLIWENLDIPRAIALHYHNGLMFWSDWGKSAKIEVAEMDGSNRKAIITEKLQWPNGLAVDRPAGRLYWNDGKLKTIESSDLRGKDRRIIITDVPHPYGLVVVGNHMYWTDWQTQGLHRAEKSNGSNRTMIRDKLEGLMDVRSVQTDNMAENACGWENGGCSHLCLRNAQGYSCACPTGINMMKGSSRNCAFQPLNYLLFATRGSLARISLDTPEFWEHTLPIDNIQHVIDVDFYWAGQEIIYTDIKACKIQAIAMRNFSDVRDIITTNISIPNGVAVDWLGQSIYWTDEGKKTIEVAKVDGKMRKVIVSTGLDEPRSIAVFPQKGYVYWTDWGKHPKIERSFMDGSGRKIIADTNLGFPNGLVIDYKRRRLYWTDAKLDRIETSDLNGRSRIQIVHNSATKDTQPFALALLDDYIYWTDWYQKSVVRADKPSGKNAAYIRTNLDGAMGIITYSERRQAGWNPCKDHNGFCTHFCFYLQNNYTCGCPDEPIDHTCKTELKTWIPEHPELNMYEDDDYNSDVDFDDIYAGNNVLEQSHVLLYFIIILPVLCVLFLIGLGVMLLIAYKKSKKKYLYATGRSVMTFSNPNYYTTNNGEQPGTAPLPTVDKKPFLWKRLKYDKSQERVYEDKAGCSSPEVASLIPATLTPSSSNCEAVTPELDRSPSITPIHRLDSPPTVA